MSNALHHPSSLLEKLDRQRTLKFLSAIASVDAKQNKLGHSSLDEFRVALNDIHASQSSSVNSRTFFTSLADTKCEFINYYLQRFGTIGFCRNLLRHHLASCIADMTGVLTGMGNEILDRVNLTLNRPMYTYVGGDLEGVCPLSTALIDYVQVLEQTCDYLRQAEKLSHEFLGSPVARLNDQEFQFESELANELGFSTVKWEVLPYQNEKQALHLMNLGIQIFVDATEAVSHQLKMNMLRDSTAPMIVSCDNIRSEVSTFMNGALPNTDNIELWELQKIRLLATTRRIITEIEGLSRKTIESITTTRNLLQPTEHRTTSHMVRSLVVFMVHKGAKSMEAQKIANNLFQYCRDHDVTPGSLIPAELQKISPLLDIQCADYLRTQEQEKSLQLNVSAKDQNLRRANSMRQSLSKYATTLCVILLCASSILSGCGVKSAPRSKLEDFRPAIPFQVDATEAADRQGTL